MNTTKCDNCGHEYGNGEWPFCPHGFGAYNEAERPMEPYFDEHVCPEGAWITTRGQRRALMKANNAEYRDGNDRLTGSKRNYPGRVKYLDLGGR